MPRHSLASPKTVHQKNPRSRQGRNLPGMPFGSFMATAQCRRMASVRLWAQLSSNLYRDPSRFPQPIDTPPASKSKGKLSIGCFFLFRSLIENSWTSLPSNPRNDGRRWGRNSAYLLQSCVTHQLSRLLTKSSICSCCTFVGGGSKRWRCNSGGSAADPRFKASLSERQRFSACLMSSSAALTCSPPRPGDITHSFLMLLSRSLQALSADSAASETAMITAALTLCACAGLASGETAIVAASVEARVMIRFILWPFDPELHTRYWHILRTCNMFKSGTP